MKIVNKNEIKAIIDPFSIKILKLYKSLSSDKGMNNRHLTLLNFYIKKLIKFYLKA